jgi:hypothetical protein
MIFMVPLSRDATAKKVLSNTYSCAEKNSAKEIKKGKEAKNILELKVSQIWRYLFNVSLSLVRPPREKADR